MLTPNKVLGHYKVISAIGAGGMGEVYLAEDTELERKVAIKLLSEEFSQDTEKLTRFIQEAKAASALNHPNILTVYEIGEFENSRYIVTEYIDGKTLSDVLESKLPETDRVIEYAIQIASALEAAHQAGIIHRDIKASNVMVRHDGIVKLLDFGLAKVTYQSKGDGLDSEAPTLENILTVPGMLLGTPTYMSPEQARGKKLDVRTDIFSFGILLFEMLTGRRPFVGESYADIMGAILKDEPPPLEKYLENVSPELDYILTKTLRKDRRQRYQNATDLLVDLKNLQEDLKFEAKLEHTTQDTKNKFIHSTDSIALVPTVRINTETQMVRKFSYLQILLLIAGVLVVAVGGWWLASGLKSEAVPSTPVTLPKKDIFTWNSAPGEIFSTGEFSPDGRTIAFASAKTGTLHLWIKQTVSGEAIQITKDEFNNQNPIWSPNGNEIAFFSERGKLSESGDTSTGIWRIPSFGGTPTLITPIKDGSMQLRFWSKEGKIYYESNHNLFAVNIETGKSEQITKFETENANIKFINISTDEKQIAYAENEKNVWKLMVRSLLDGTSRKIASSDGEIGSVVWHPDNQRVLYSPLVNGTFQIFVADSVSLNPRQITFTEMNSLVVDISQDGSNILLGSAKEESNLWQVNINSRTERSVAANIDAELWASVSGESKKIAFQSVKNMSQGNNLFNGSILVTDPGSKTAPEQITNRGFLPTWSPDGQSLAFLRVEEDLTQIWSVKTPGGREERLTKGGMRSIGYSVSPYNRIQTSDFSWSPDSKSIVYVADRNGLSNIWTVTTDRPFESSLTGNSDENLLLYCPVWSSDGTKLAYYSKSKKPAASGDIKYALWIFDTETKESNMVAELMSVFRLIGWSVDESKLIIASPSKSGGLPPEVELSEIDVKSGQKDTLITLKTAYFYNFYLSPDRKKLAYVANLEDKDDIWILDTSNKQKTKLTNNNDSNLYFSSLAWSPDGEDIYFGKQTRYSLLSMLTNYK